MHVPPRVAVILKPLKFPYLPLDRQLSKRGSIQFMSRVFGSASAILPIRRDDR